MAVGAGLYMHDVVVKKFTFAISFPDEFLLLTLYNGHRRRLYCAFTIGLRACMQDDATSCSKVPLYRFVIMNCSLLVMVTSGQSTLTTGRITAAYGRFNGIRQDGASEHPI